MAVSSFNCQACRWSSSPSSTLPPRARVSVARARTVAVSSKKRGFELRAVAEATATGTAMEAVELKKGIAELYDESSGLWEDLWGDHMHHGFYDPNATDVSVLDHRAAQTRMIDEVLRFAGISGLSLSRSRSRSDLCFDF